MVKRAVANRVALSEPLQQIDRTYVLFRGRKLTYFGGCDYFRLASHPEVMRALTEGLEKFGLNVAASRATTGNHKLFADLEKALARFFDVEAALLMSNGYATNLAVAQALAHDFTHVFIDERAHASPLDAAELLRVRARKFRHRDLSDLRGRVRALPPRSRPLVITDGMFSHDGSIAPLAEMLHVLPKRAGVLLDDAHGAGTLGATGKGTPEESGVHDARVVQTISLSKAFGVYGGAILGSGETVQRIAERSQLFRGNTPLPLPLASAALASVRLLTNERALRQRLRANVQRVKTALREAGLPVVPGASPVVAVWPRSAADAKSLERELLRARIHPPMIRYGTDVSGYFRFAISSEHTPAQLDALVGVLRSRR